MIATLISSIFLVNGAVEKFLERKVAIRISDKRHDVGEIPFPAITFCPELMISEENMDMGLLKNLSQK